MKEATGELNMTVVTVVAIAAVAAFFYAFVWPGIQRSIEASTYCSMATGCDEEYKNCSYTDEDGGKHNDLDCSSYEKDLLKNVFFNSRDYMLGHLGPSEMCFNETF